MEDKRNETCWWQAPIEIMDNTTFITSCRDNRGKGRGKSPNNFCYKDFKYCPWCGGKIKWISSGEVKADADSD